MLTTLRVNARHVAGTPVIAQMGFNTKGFQPNLKPEYQSTVHYSKQKRNKFHPCFFYFACVPILIFVSVRRILKIHRLNRHESSQRVHRRPTSIIFSTAYREVGSLRPGFRDQVMAGSLFSSFYAVQSLRVRWSMNWRISPVLESFIERSFRGLPPSLMLTGIGSNGGKILEQRPEELID
ncbi:hypothetical protein F5888DRAFT_1308406 [Russula emetica]|nr:hypothetical protein F5888DRAFT_1308406 [Russula emetica]